MGRATSTNFGDHHLIKKHATTCFHFEFHFSVVLGKRPTIWLMYMPAVYSSLRVLLVAAVRGTCVELVQKSRLAAVVDLWTWDQPNNLKRLL